MEIYKTKLFNKWQKKENLSDQSLYIAIEQMKAGLIDANLGSGLFKKRVAKPGLGKRGSYRTIIASKINNVWFFVFGFDKNDKENITEREKEALAEVAQYLLNLTDTEKNKLIEENKLFEVNHENK